MTSVVELEIALRRATLAELFTDPRLTPQWMDEIARVEPVTGELGAPGSVYRLVPKRGKTAFVATVVSRELPAEAKLLLDAPTVSVSVTGRLVELSERRTKLISEETFRFKGLLGSLLGYLAQRAIRSAHRRHMESFKRFAESHGDRDGA
jgi:hypothetical protein